MISKIFFFIFLINFAISQKTESIFEFTKRIDLKNQRELNNIISQLEDKIVEYNLEEKQMRVIETLQLDKADKIINKLRKIVNNNYKGNITHDSLLIMYYIYHAYHDIIIPNESKMEINLNIKDDETNKLITLDDINILETCKNGLLIKYLEITRERESRNKVSQETHKSGIKTYKVLNELYKQKLLYLRDPTL